MVVSRAYNTFSIDETLQTISKYSSSDRLEDEIQYYIKSKNVNMDIFFPRLISQSKDGNIFAGKFEYYAYPNLGDKIFFSDSNPKMLDRIANKLRDILNLWSNVKIETNNTTFNEAMFIDKTETEYLKLVSNFNFFKSFSKNKEVSINKKSYKNFEVIWPQIKEIINKRLIQSPTNTFIHGDLCFSNILCGECNENIVLKFIDPRGSYGAKGCFGNRLYDLSKLMHSYEGGYEFIINDKFDVSSDEKSINFRLDINNVDFRAFDTLFNSEDEKENARLIQGLIYIGMIARHYDSLDRQKIMYATGIRILNSFID